MIEICEELFPRGNNSLIKKILQILLVPTVRTVFTIRIAQKFYNKGYIKIAKLISLNLINKYGLHIGLSSTIGKGLVFRHPNGIIIGDGVEIGENVVIYQQVTIGGKRIGDAQKNNYPHIGDNVTIFAGAKLIGNIVVGDNSIIGANSVVLEDVEPNGVYAGIPAKKVNTVRNN